MCFVLECKFRVENCRCVGAISIGLAMVLLVAYFAISLFNIY